MLTADQPVERTPAHRLRSALWRSDLRLYLAGAVLTAAGLTWMMKLWRATLSAPFYYSGDAVASAAYFKSVIQVGWYENQPALGAPYGQHYHDYPFADDLNPAMAKVLTLFTDNWAVAFNLYYLLTFLLCALTAVWFCRQIGLGSPLSVVASVLYALAPYHFIRNEGHLFLSAYYCLPLAMVVVLRAAAGTSLWGRRAGGHPVLSVLTGRGAGTVLILVLVTYDGAYYGLFTAILLGFGGLLGLTRRWSWRQLGGLAMAGAVLVGAFLLAMLPDTLYERAHGTDTAGLVRAQAATEFYALKFSSLVLPAPGHPIPFLARMRLLYDSKYPLPSELPALGLVAAIGFVLLLGMALLSLNGRFGRSAGTPDQAGRLATLFTLSFLTWCALCVATIGGLSTLLSYFVPSIRGWNRMSIVIALFSLAGLGLAVESLVQYFRQRLAARDAGSGRPTRRRPLVARAVVPLVAVLLLLVGGADQSISGAVPSYPANKRSSDSDQHYVDALQAGLPAGAMIFQLPWQQFPESETSNGIPESDQLKLWLHSTTLRFSSGGIKGRPQTDWPGTVVTMTPATMVRDLAAIGFAGISIHRTALADRGRKWEAALRPMLGSPSLVSQDLQYSYLSLAPARKALDATTTPAQQSALAAVITRIQP